MQTPSLLEARPASTHVPNRTDRVRLPDDVQLDSGNTDRIDRWIDYSIAGPDRAPLVIALGGISANRHVQDGPRGESGWWRHIVGPGLAVDTRSVRVLGIDWLGRRLDRPTTAPDATRTDVDYPRVSTRDQARALAHVLDTLGEVDVAAFVGASYGGMVGLAFASDYPTRLQRLVVLCAAHRPHPMATAHRAVQRGIVHLAGERGDPAQGLTLARALAMTTYRTSEEFDDRFEVRPVPGSNGAFEVEQYLYARGRQFRDHFEPDAFCCLSHSIDLHHVDPETVRVPTHLVSFDSDTLVPVWLIEELERELVTDCEHHRLTSRVGHDGFLKETQQVGALLSQLLADVGGES
ncbi:MAG: homoserine O-succinyltransferase [Gemmatimonadota bacterium]